MPPLLRPARAVEVTLPPRAALLAARTDVLVVGGGPAGIGAAVAAAEAGVDVVLAERYGFLGGNATVALVMPLMSFHRQRRHAVAGDATRLLPTDHGEGDPMVAGVLGRMLERLVDAGGAVPPSTETGYTVPFDPELFKLTAQDLLDEAGVQVLLHALASGHVPLDDGHRVVFETKSGPVVIDARVVVDCTGDGDVAAAAGAPYEVGREEDGLAQPMTLHFRMVDVVAPEFARYVREHPDQWRGVHGLWDLVAEATKAGELELPREDVLFFATPHPGEISVNSTRVTGAHALDAWDLTRAEIASRRQMAQIARFLRERVPGFGESYVVQSGVAVGVRESRRFHGEYRLTTEDVLEGRTFDDGIARCAYPADIHNPQGVGTLLRRLPPGQSYDLPLRSLVPLRVEGLLVAGRSISGTHVAHSSYRIMPVCMATGQAAGACAALAVRQGRQPRHVAAWDVQKLLREQGATLRPGLGE
ncbi:MAG TPA: FAD-dependent oxidoreductase [Pseudonocardia sp.]|nr:FAD-dependent oxidoreductase [Pseudonocardia sp.]